MPADGEIGACSYRVRSWYKPRGRRAHATTTATMGIYVRARDRTRKDFREIAREERENGTKVLSNGTFLACL